MGNVRLRRGLFFRYLCPKGEEPVEREIGGNSDSGRGKDVEPGYGNCL